MMNARQFLELTRLNHGLIVAFAILTGSVLALKSLPPFGTFMISAFCGVFIQAASFSIGDYWDIRTDKANRRKDRPLARGKIRPERAIDVAMALFLAGLVLGYFLNSMAFYIAIVFALVGIAYGYYLKNIALIGNMATSAAMAIPFIFGAVVFTESIPMSVWIISLVAFLSGTGREMIKGVQDYEGDKQTGRKTFAIKAGKQNAFFFAESFILLSIAVSVLPFFYLSDYYMNIPFISLIIINAVIWIKSVKDAKKMKNLEKTRKMTFYGMLIGTAAFLIGALF